jgi:hypothetical protein
MKSIKFLTLLIISILAINNLDAFIRGGRGVGVGVGRGGVGFTAGRGDFYGGGRYGHGRYGRGGWVGDAALAPAVIAGTIGAAAASQYDPEYDEHGDRVYYRS